MGPLGWRAWCRVARGCCTPAVAPRPPRRGARDREGRRQRDVSWVSREDEVYSSGRKRLRLGEREVGDLEPGRAGRKRRSGERSLDLWRVPGKSRGGGRRGRGFQGVPVGGGRCSGCFALVMAACSCLQEAPRVRRGIRQGDQRRGSGFHGRRVGSERARSGRGVVPFGWRRVWRRGYFLLDHGHAVEYKLEGGVSLARKYALAMSASVGFSGIGICGGRGGVGELVRRGTVRGR